MGNQYGITDRWDNCFSIKERVVQGLLVLRRLRTAIDVKTRST